MTPPCTPGGAWIQTYTGVAFPLLEPDERHVNSVDIAHALARLCRFGGHSRRFYSVAQHSVLVARWLRDQGYHRDVVRHGLLHDAAEAYVVDVPRPLKQLLQRHAEIEHQVQRAIWAAFRMRPEIPAAVHEADQRILADERQHVMGPCDVDWCLREKPLGLPASDFDAWMPAIAERRFNDMLLELVP